MNAPLLLEHGSSALTIVGALLLAMRSRWAGWAWVLWLIANCGWITFGTVHAIWGLVAQHAVLFVTSAIGIRKWLWRPGAFPRLRIALRQRWCRHQFRGVDLTRRDESGLVRWPCGRCGKVFTAPYGLAAAHGSITGPWLHNPPSTTTEKP